MAYVKKSENKAGFLNDVVCDFCILASPINHFGSIKKELNHTRGLFQ